VCPLVDFDMQECFVFVLFTTLGTNRYRGMLPAGSLNKSVLGFDGGALARLGPSANRWLGPVCERELPWLGS
jgi:hypothetical protein